MRRAFVWAALGWLALVGTTGAAYQKEQPRKVANDPGDPEARKAFEAIRGEYDAAIEAMQKAVAKIEDDGESMRLYHKMNPDVVAYSRRMIDFAIEHPRDPAARDALIWVLNHPNMGGQGSYGVEFGRAGDLLVMTYGDDPEAVRIGLGLDNVLDESRDALMYGFLAAAKDREAKGLARMAMAQYLHLKGEFAEHARKNPERARYKFEGYNEKGELKQIDMEQPDEEYAYRLHLAHCDAEFMKAEAERMAEEVVSEYADLPFITVRMRELQALLDRPNPTWGGEPLTPEMRSQIEEILARKKTLGEAAAAKLDDWRNLAVGKAAPEIEAPDVNGKTLRLSEYRGKVVALVFWGSWCGPCMAEVPHEKELMERLKGRPFTMLGVNTDTDAETARKVMDREGISWPNWFDGEPGEGPITRLYHVEGYPTIYVIDADGKIAAKNARGEGLDQLVDKLVAEAEQGAKPADADGD